MAIKEQLSAAPMLQRFRAEGGDLFLLAEESAIKRDPNLISSLFDLEGETYFCKCFSLRGVKGFLQRLTGQDRARRLHRHVKVLQTAGVPVAESLGYVLDGNRALWLSQALPFRSLLYWAGSALPESTEERQAICASAVNAMIGLHRAGFCHGDFKWGNLLYDDQQKVIWLVDLDGVKKRANRNSYDRSAARDLARFVLDCEEAGVSDKELPAIYRQYAQAMSVSESEVMELAGPIYQKLKQRHIDRYGENHRLQPPIA